MQRRCLRHVSHCATSPAWPPGDSHPSQAATTICGGAGTGQEQPKISLHLRHHPHPIRTHLGSSPCSPIRSASPWGSTRDTPRLSRSWDSPWGAKGRAPLPELGAQLPTPCPSFNPREKSKQIHVRTLLLPPLPFPASHPLPVSRSSPPPPPCCPREPALSSHRLSPPLDPSPPSSHCVSSCPPPPTNCQTPFAEPLRTTGLIRGKSGKEMLWPLAWGQKRGNSGCQASVWALRLQTEESPAQRHGATRKARRRGQMPTQSQRARSRVCLASAEPEIRLVHWE